MRRISYILLLGILLSACQKNTKSEGTNLPVEVISPIKKTETDRSREYTFYQGPIMRQSYLSASMAPS